MRDPVIRAFRRASMRHPFDRSMVQNLRVGKIFVQVYLNGLAEKRAVFPLVETIYPSTGFRFWMMEYVLH